VYLPKEGDVTVQLGTRDLRSNVVQRIHRREGPLPPVQGGAWKSPKTPGWLDWALLLQKRR